MPEKTIYIARNPYHEQYHFGVMVPIGLRSGGAVRYTRESWETEQEARDAAEKRYGAAFGATLRFVQGGVDGWLVPLQKAKQI